MRNYFTYFEGIEWKEKEIWGGKAGEVEERD